MSTAAKVGAFFLVVLAIAGLLIWKIEDLRLGRGEPTRVTVEFKDVAGLDEKTAVRVAGVRVGKVTKIRLVDGKALVDVELDRDVALRQGASASIESQGLLGEKYVELVPGPVRSAASPGRIRSRRGRSRHLRRDHEARARHRGRHQGDHAEPEGIDRRARRGKNASGTSSRTCA